MKAKAVIFMHLAREKPKLYLQIHLDKIIGLKI